MMMYMSGISHKRTASLELNFSSFVNIQQNQGEQSARAIQIRYNYVNCTLDRGIGPNTGYDLKPIIMIIKTLLFFSF